MQNKQNPQFHEEQLDDSSTIMILGENMPILIEAIAAYIKKYGGKVKTRFDKEIKVDYLLIFDQDEKVRNFLKVLKPKGKVLHVVSHQITENKNFPAISSYHLSPAKTYKSTTLIRLLLSKLYASQIYLPVRPIKPAIVIKEKEVSSKPHLLHQLKKTARKILVTLLIMFFSFSLVIMIWASSVAITLYNLNSLRDTSLSYAQQTKVIKNSETAISVAKNLSPFSNKMIGLISPKTAIIANEHMTIISSLVQTAKIVLEQSTVIEPFARTITSKDANKIQENSKQVKQALSVIQTSLQPAIHSINNLSADDEHFLVKPLWQKYNQLLSASESIANAHIIIDRVPSLFAVKTRKTYMVLLQNNFEIRPTGGFIGSFALLTMENGTIKEVKVEDVYEADGQLKGNVDPPDPIRTYLNQPHWFLRDSNWNPDFALSAKQAEWFLEKETGQQVDGVIAMDLYFLQYLLEALDGVYVPDYQATVYADDFFYKLQNDTHDKFFPGSNKKQNLISSLTNALFIDLTNQDSATLTKVALAIEKAFEEKHLMIYIHNDQDQQTVEQLGWAGRIVSHQDVPGSLSEKSVFPDYLMVVDANLGVNKVNSVIKRELFITIDIENNKLIRENTVYYKNQSSQEINSLYSGIYKNYLRFLIPKNAEITSLRVGDSTVNILEKATIQTFGDKKTVGILVEVLPQNDAKISIRYELDILQRPFSYQLMIQKQPGTYNDSLMIKISKKAEEQVTKKSIPAFSYNTTLLKDQMITVDFERKID